jgi:predicted peptidase
MVDQALENYPVDANRLYVAGFSMGGGGTWNLLNRYPDKFAAAVPVNGILPDSDFAASNLVGIPTWAFHARNDSVVAKERTRERIESILAAAGEPPITYPPDGDASTLEFVNHNIELRYTEWPTGGHPIWNRAYANPQLQEWLFEQTLAVPEPKLAVLLCEAIAVFRVVRSRRRR